MKTTRPILLPLIAIFLAAVAAAYVPSAPGNFSVYQDTLDQRETPRRECREHLWAIHVGRDIPQSQIINDEIEVFQILAERSPVCREPSIGLATSLKTQIKARAPLSGGELDLLNVQLVSYPDLRQQPYQVAEAHECWLAGAKDFLARLSVTPFERYQAVMLSLSAALVFKTIIFWSYPFSRNIRD